MHRDALHQTFASVRQATVDLAAPLSAEDCAVQSMPDASPVKWHLAHTTWFFETFVLSRGLPAYRPFQERFTYLYNSYYNAVGDQYPRPRRGLMTRPSLDEIRAYRAHVDRAMRSLFTEAGGSRFGEVEDAIELGINHEEQHQELILTDVKHLLAQNPLSPAYAGGQHATTVDVLPSAEEPWVEPKSHQAPPPPNAWLEFPGGLIDIGDAGLGFAFDNERPLHKAWLEPFHLAGRPVTNGEYLMFLEDGGYNRPELWLSLGWATVRAEAWKEPLYWEHGPEGTMIFTLGGRRPLDLSEPVCHLSFFEADAYARWAGARLPTEEEWEYAALAAGEGENFAERKRWHPAPAVGLPETRLLQMFGDIWEWTASAYLGYPGYRPAEGALGEYNGKFMCNQFVLRGGSCATPSRHFRRTYRNFFPPDARWQFTGLRLAR